MRPSSRHPCSPSSPAALGPRLPARLVGGVLVLLAGGLIASAARAEDKLASFATVAPAVPLGAKQLADIAAKGVPNVPQATIVMPTPTNHDLRAAEPPTGAERVATAVSSLKPRRLPTIAEAMGPIPRESWIRMALGKSGDVAVIGGRIVGIETDGAPR
jgi:hypothetical protein